MPITLLHTFCVVVAAIVLAHWRRTRPPLPLPPGPAKLPLVGNLFDFPSGFDWEVYEAWGKQYNSDIIHISVPGTSIIILNSVKAARDLFEKRSALYSSRPKFTLVNKFLGFSWLMPFMPYGPAWKERRRFFQRHVHPNHDKTSRIQEKVREYSRYLLLRLLETPDDYLKHIQHAVGGALESAAYGSKAKQDNTSYLAVAGEIMEVLSDVSIPISALVDSIPWILPVLPIFLSGPAFRKGDAYWKGLRYKFRDEPFLHAQNSSDESFVSRCLENMQPSQDENLQHDLIKDAASIFFIGGSATTIALMHTFVLTMLAFPEVQAKAQSELDSVVGHGRLPEFIDEPQLPFLSALMKEVHRWNTVGPIGIPHFLETNDEYNGFLIPGQSIVIGNAWAMLHDETEYPNPRSFNPERFLKEGKLDSSVRDPATIVFGFGRRICPGAHIAHSLSWMQAAMILSSFNISKAVDENGITIEPSMEFHNGLTLQPVPFKCKFTPRHAKVGKHFSEGA